MASTSMFDFGYSLSNAENNQIGDLGCSNLIVHDWPHLETLVLGNISFMLSSKLDRRPRLSKTGHGLLAQVTQSQFGLLYE
jgi:hypothetical protein